LGLNRAILQARIEAYENEQQRVHRRAKERAQALRASMAAEEAKIRSLKGLRDQFRVGDYVNQLHNVAKHKVGWQLQEMQKHQECADLKDEVAMTLLGIDDHFHGKDFTSTVKHLLNEVQGEAPPPGRVNHPPPHRVQHSTQRAAETFPPCVTRSEDIRRHKALQKKAKKKASQERREQIRQLLQQAEVPMVAGETHLPRLPLVKEAVQDLNGDNLRYGELPHQRGDMYDWNKKTLHKVKQAQKRVKQFMASNSAAKAEEHERARRALQGRKKKYAHNYNNASFSAPGQFKDACTHTHHLSANAD